MSYRRLLPAVVLLIIAISLTGCERSYFFSFKDEQDLVNDQGAWYAYGEEDETYCFQAEGANFINSCLTAPLRFNDDFSLTVRFRLIADNMHPVSFGIVLCDTYYYDPCDKNMVTFEVHNGGGADYYSMKVGNDEGTIHIIYNEVPMVPGLVCDGDNTFVLTRTGYFIHVKINDVEAADFTLASYKSRWFIPNVYAFNHFLNDPTYGFTLQSVEMKYKGFSLKAPPPPATP